MKYLIRWLTLASVLVLVGCGGGGCTVTPFGNFSTNNACPPPAAATPAPSPSQNRTSLSATLLNIEAFQTDGVTTNLTLRTSDRNGNPVPAGTAVTFIASHGTVDSSCVIDSTGACSVTYTSSGTRPADGVATILAYLAGEESFVDADGNNMWTSPETFSDMGQPYLDINHNGAYDVGVDQPVGSRTGSAACPVVTPNLSIPNTCDNTWTSSILVRQQIQIGWSTHQASITASTISGTGFTVNVASAGGSGVAGMAFGSSIAAVLSSSTPSPTCAIVGAVSPSAIVNDPYASDYQITLNNNACTGGTITVTVTVTSPAGVSTAQPVLIP